MASKGGTASGHGRCPICRGPAELAFRPFCSARCRDVDLARWLGGSYAIAGGEAAIDEDGEDVAAQRAGGSLHPGDDEDGN